MTVPEPVWLIRPDLHHLETFDLESDLELVPFPRHDLATGLIETAPFPVPDEVQFEGHFPALDTTDMPISPEGWSIVSRRMLAVLTGAGPLPRHRVIPLAIIDDRVPPPDRTDAAGALKPEVVRRDFVALHLLEHADVFDYDRSVYQRHRLVPELVSRVRKLVLRPFPGPMPPIFRLAARPAALFVSDAARRALESTGIRGVVFAPLERFVG